MKIRSVEVFVFKYNHHYKLGGHTNTPGRLPGTDYYFEPKWKQAYSRLTETCLVKITTDENIFGWGEAQAPLVPEVPAILISKLLGPAILGLNPLDTEFIYDRLYHISNVRGHATSFTIDAIAAIDMALWDIKGKVNEKPLSTLLATDPKKELPLYISGLRKPTLEERKAFTEAKLKEGYKGFKIFINDTPQKTLAEFEAIRTVIGTETVLAFDAICAHGYDDALEIGKGLDTMNAYWLEAPLDPEDVDGHAQLAKAISTPLAIGEPLRTVREFEPWFEKRAMNVAQPDIVRCGITGAVRIINEAQKAGLKIAPHIGVCSVIGVAATWHVAASINDVMIQEHQYDMFPVMNKVLENPLEVLNGKAIVPRGNGLGIDVDEAFVLKHSSENWKIEE